MVHIIIRHVVLLTVMEHAINKNKKNKKHTYTLTHTYIIHTYIHAHIHTYTLTYTYIHTYIHTCQMPPKSLPTYAILL